MPTVVQPLFSLIIEPISLHVTIRVSASFLLPQVHHTDVFCGIGLLPSKSHFA
jgi:hypothetical protein